MDDNTKHDTPTPTPLANFPRKVTLAELRDVVAAGAVMDSLPLIMEQLKRVGVMTNPPVQTAVMHAVLAAFSAGWDLAVTAIRDQIVADWSEQIDGVTMDDLLKVARSLDTMTPGKVH